MNFHSLINDLLTDTLDVSLPLFTSELILCATIVLMLLFKVIPGGARIPSFVIALGGSVLALYMALPLDGFASWQDLGRQELFTGMLVYDTLTAYVRVFLFSFLVLFIILSQLTGIADREDGQDYFSLVLGATVGMCVMLSANHLLTVFLGVEMASVPSYVLAGIVKGRRRSSEAALKYCIYGAGTAGVMLYGVSLLAGVLGSAHLPTMAQELAAMDIPGMMASGTEGSKLMVLALGGLMLGVGLAFKLSAVPFHFWCPDVFEGASAEIDAFLSVASKAAALALLLRVGLGLTHLQESPEVPLAVSQPAVTTLVATDLITTNLVATDVSTNLVATDTKAPELKPALLNSETTVSADNSGGPLGPVRNFVVTILVLVGMASCTFGNLAAYGQTNIKRMLAYSTIAHAGYMILAAAATISLFGSDPVNARLATSALLFYVTIYLFMNLGAFAIIAFLRNAMQSEEIEDYAGLIRSLPLVAIMMTIIMVSLIGLPPMAGFWPKLQVLRALYEAGGTLMITALVVAGINTGISLIYYLRVIKKICIDPEPDTRGPVSLGFLPTAYILVVSLPVFFLGLFPDTLARWADHAAQQFLG